MATSSRLLAVAAAYVVTFVLAMWLNWSVPNWYVKQLASSWLARLPGHERGADR